MFVVQRDIEGKHKGPSDGVMTADICLLNHLDKVLSFIGLNQILTPSEDFLKD